jgi:REP element-mobilizing transposase RayT
MIMKAYKHWDEERYILWAIVVMPDHVHKIIRPLADYNLGKINHSIRSYTAHQINEFESCDGILWREEPYDRMLRNSNEYYQKIEYIKENPERAGLVKLWKDYSWIYFRPELLKL